MADHLAPSPARAAQWSDARKFLAHLAAAVLALVLTAASDGIDAVEALQLLVLLCGTTTVYVARNRLTGPWAYAKAVAAWTAVVAAAAVPFAAGGWSGLLDGAPVIAAAAAGALGVGVLPNTGGGTLADSVQDILEQLRELRDTVTTPPAASGSTLVTFPPASGGTVSTVQVREPHAPAATARPPVAAPPPRTAGARTAASPVDTGTLEAVRARGAGSYLDPESSS